MLKTTASATTIFKRLRQHFLYWPRVLNSYKFLVNYNHCASIAISMLVKKTFEVWPVLSIWPNRLPNLIYTAHTSKTVISSYNVCQVSEIILGCSSNSHGWPNQSFILVRVHDRNKFSISFLDKRILREKQKDCERLLRILKFDWETLQSY